MRRVLLSALAAALTFAVQLATTLAASARRSPTPNPQRPTPAFQSPARSPWDVDEREYLGTPATERAVARALAYLARTQNPDGSWTSSSYTSEAGIVGLCSLAFL